MRGEKEVDYINMNNLELNQCNFGAIVVIKKSVWVLGRESSLSAKKECQLNGVLRNVKRKCAYKP